MGRKTTVPIPISLSVSMGAGGTSILWLIPLPPWPLRGCSTRQLINVLAEKRQALDPLEAPTDGSAMGISGSGRAS